MLKQLWRTTDGHPVTVRALAKLSDAVALDLMNGTIVGPAENARLSNAYFEIDDSGGCCQAPQALYVVKVHPTDKRMLVVESTTDHIHEVLKGNLLRSGYERVRH